jgi:hypothetical protein
MGGALMKITHYAALLRVRYLTQMPILSRTTRRRARTKAR